MAKTTTNPPHRTTILSRFLTVLVAIVILGSMYLLGMNHGAKVAMKDAYDLGYEAAMLMPQNARDAFGTDVRVLSGRVAVVTDSGLTIQTPAILDADGLPGSVTVALTADTAYVVETAKDDDVLAEEFARHEADLAAFNALPEEERGPLPAPPSPTDLTPVALADISPGAVVAITLAEPFNSGAEPTALEVRVTAPAGPAGEGTADEALVPVDTLETEVRDFGPGSADDAE